MSILLHFLNNSCRSTEVALECLMTILSTAGCVSSLCILSLRWLTCHQSWLYRSIQCLIFLTIRNWWRKEKKCLDFTMNCGECKPDTLCTWVEIPSSPGGESHPHSQRSLFSHDQGCCILASWLIRIQRLILDLQILGYNLVELIFIWWCFSLFSIFLRIYGT